MTFSDAVNMLLRNSVEKRAVLENLDLVLLWLDETIDDGRAFFRLLTDLNYFKTWVCSIIVEMDSTTIASKVSRPKADTTKIIINEQTIMSVYQTVKEKMQLRM